MNFYNCRLAVTKELIKAKQTLVYSRVVVYMTIPQWFKASLHPPRVAWCT